MKTHVNLSIDVEVWTEYKAECADRGLIVGKEVQGFMEAQLAKWQKETK